ncbi:MAG: VCBS repeat-containing protein [Verrucomicrobiota bacterium]
MNEDSEYSAVAVMDVNGDGVLDIVCGGWWYEGPGWERHFLREVAEIRGRYDGYSHLPYDVDGDGWTDFINVNYRSESIFWVEHPGEALGEGGVWKRRVIALPGPMETGRLVDVDGDGNLDILPNGRRFAAWWQFEREQDESGTWKRRFVKRDLPVEVAGHGLGFGDVNGDGRGDVVGPTGWLEAPEDRVTGEWIWHGDFELDRDASVPVIVMDVDGDGDADLIWGRGHDYGIYWLEQGDGGTWERHVIDESWSQAHALLWEDLDGDGREWLISGKRYMAHDGKDPGAHDPLGVYAYRYEPEEGEWERRVICEGGGVGFGLDPKAADLDGDGDTDLVVSGRSGLYWLENLKED